MEVGTLVGMRVGTDVGVDDGVLVVGRWVGTLVGMEVGTLVGIRVGTEVGVDDGVHIVVGSKCANTGNDNVMGGHGIITCYLVEYIGRYPFHLRQRGG